MLDDKEAAYRARNALLQEKENRLSQQSMMAEQEKAKLSSLQLAVETMSERASQSFAEEKLRLQREHARLEQMQRSLESERAVMQESVTAEAKKLEDMRLQREHEHAAFVEEVNSHIPQPLSVRANPYLDASSVNPKS